MRLTYLALGDSYTIGESVPLSESFPHLLAAQLETFDVEVGEPKIIAQTGWTTGELKAAIDGAALQQTFGLVTLLIGVNNQYRGYDLIAYRKEFRELLQMAIGFAGGRKEYAFVMSIPDWGLTPFGKASGRDVQVISQEIDAFNAVNKEETLAAGIAYTDITAASRKAAADLSLVAGDGLHYSAKMHARWVSSLESGILDLLQRP